MQKRFFYFIVVIGLFLINNQTFGQLSMSYQISRTNKATIGYNFSKTVWTEIRLSSNSSEEIIPDLALLFNVSKKEKHDFYIGVSCISEDEIKVSVPFGVQFRPIESFKQLSFLIEFQPILNGNGTFRSSAGIRYKFRE